MNVAVIDDDQAICRSLQIHIEEAGHEVVTAQDVSHGLELLRSAKPDLAFVDLRLPDGTGLDILRTARDWPAPPVLVMITGTQDTKATIEAVRLGAFDYIRKPIDLEAIQLVLEKFKQYRASPVPGSVMPISEFAEHPNEIVGADPAITEVVKQVGLLSQNRIPVLIQGESGTGKELVARALHEACSPGRPFVALNCSAVVPTLLESDLFGHVKGAFTGADTDKMGRFQLAADGTIFFDEIGDLAQDIQGKLLRVLQERRYEPVGSVKSMVLEARVVAATNRDLRSMVAEGTFREDLFYRLEVSTIRVPPLRERPQDIPLLAGHLLGRITRDLQKKVEAMEDGALSRLEAHDWPGNVRELENVLTRAAILTRNSLITADVIVAALQSDFRPKKVAKGVRTLREAERDHVQEALQSTGWNISQTARILDISPTTLRKKVGDYRLSP